MNPYSVMAHSISVKIVAEEFVKRGGWTYDLYDSNLPIGPDNNPSPIEETGMFGAPNHTVTFFNESGVNETVVAGLLIMMPDVAWTELSKKLGVKERVSGPGPAPGAARSNASGDDGSGVFGGGAR